MSEKKCHFKYIKVARKKTTAIKDTKVNWCIFNCCIHYNRFALHHHQAHKEAKIYVHTYTHTNYISQPTQRPKLNQILELSRNLISVYICMCGYFYVCGCILDSAHANICFGCHLQKIKQNKRQTKRLQQAAPAWKDSTSNETEMSWSWLEVIPTHISCSC